MIGPFDSREDLDEWYDREQDYLDAMYMRWDIPWEQYCAESKELLQLYEEALEENEWE